MRLRSTGDRVGCEARGLAGRDQRGQLEAVSVAVGGQEDGEGWPVTCLSREMRTGLGPCPVGWPSVGGMDCMGPGLWTPGRGVLRGHQCPAGV